MKRPRNSGEYRLRWLSATASSTNLANLVLNRLVELETALVGIAYRRFTNYTVKTTFHVAFKTQMIQY